MKLWLSDFTAPQVLGGMTVTVSYDKDEAVLVFTGTSPTSTSKLTVGGTEVASFTDKPAINLLTPPGATVNGNVLTLTFQRALDESSVPPAGAFRVRTYHGVPCWGSCSPAVTAVSLSGKTATLTLAQTIPGHAVASVTHSPSTPALRHTDGYLVPDFRARVSVRTPDTPPVFSSATLAHSPRPEDQVLAWQGHDFEPATTRLRVLFNEPLDQGSRPLGSAFTVTVRSPGDHRVRTVAGTGTVVVNSVFTSVTLAEPVARDAVVTASYVKPSANALRDRGGNEVESFSGKTANNGAPRIESVALVSDPGPDRTYGRDEKIRVQVTFSGAVHVTGTPRQQINMGQGISWRVQPELPRGGAYYPWAEYESGSGTRTLTFAYTVKALDLSDGIAVMDRLELNGGSISSWAGEVGTGKTVDLSHPQTWLPYDARHKVDGSMKTPLFESAAVDGSTLTVTFDETLDTGSVPAPGAFYVTVNGARRNVVSGGVAIDGAVVTLTLASAVSASDTVTVRYTKPSANPLQSASGNVVDTFTDQEVTNSTFSSWSADADVR